MIVEAKLRSLGVELSDLETEYRTTPSQAHFISHYAVNNLLYLAGTVPVKDGRPFRPGVVGRDVTVEHAYEAARQAMLSSLTTIHYALGDLDRVEQAVQLIGFVNSAPGFAEQPRVVNGATDLLVELYGDRGRPTRAAIGCHWLSRDHSVELVLTVLFSGVGVRPPLDRTPRIG